MKFFKKFECDSCHKKFSRQEELMQHQQVVHDNHPYDCKECNESFSSMEEMRTHLQRMHSYKKDRN